MTHVSYRSGLGQWILQRLFMGIGLTAGNAEAQPLDLHAQALACYESQQFSAARRLFLTLAHERPADPEIDFHLGRLALWFDDGTTALIHLKRAAESTPSSARLQNALGDAFGWMAQNAPLWEKLGWARKCLTAYQRAADLAPHNPTWRWSLLGYYCAAPALAGGSFTKARAEAAAIARLDPHGGRSAQMTVALAERRFATAFTECEAALRERPDDFAALYQFGRCAALSGENTARGIAALERCLAQNPPRGEGQPTRACVYHRLGNLLEKRGDVAGAQSAYQAALREHPDFRADKISLRF